MIKKYMIVRIVNILAELKDDNSMITESCYNVVELGLMTVELAYNLRESYRFPHNYIIVPYYD
jgi:hypothetical protein